MSPQVPIRFLLTLRNDIVEAMSSEDQRMRLQLGSIIFFICPDVKIFPIFSEYFFLIIFKISDFI
jgi:hypothetical protein